MATARVTGEKKTSALSIQPPRYIRPGVVLTGYALAAWLTE